MENSKKAKGCPCPRLFALVLGSALCPYLQPFPFLPSRALFVVGRYSASEQNLLP